MLVSKIDTCHAERSRSVLKNKSILFFLGLIFSFTQIFAQQQQGQLAHASQHGIFISLGIKTSKGIDKKEPEFSIERKAENETDWKKITTVKRPESLDQFKTNLIKASAYMPEPFALRDIPYEKIWKRVTEKNVDSLGLWANVLSVKCALGLLYFDSTAKANINYTYRITNKDNPNDFFESLPKKFPEVAKVGEIKNLAHEYDGRSIKITWVVKNKKPSFVRLFRKDELGGNFIPIKAKRVVFTKSDSTFLVTTDTVTIENLFYKYYVIPMDEYGNWGNPSDTISAAAFDPKQINIPTHFKTIDDSVNTGIVLQWRVTKTTNIMKYELYRSTSFDGKYEMIKEIPGHASQYIDENAEPMKTYFYYLRVVAVDGTKLPASARISGIFKNEAAPFPPTIVSAIGVKNGVSLTIMNGQMNVIGFRLYRAVVGDSVYTQVSDLIPVREEKMMYTDTFSLSGKRFYNYRAQIENTSHQTSGLSNIVSARPLIATTPPVPINVNAKLEEGKIYLNWFDMHQIEESVVAYVVYRCQYDSVAKKYSDYKSLTLTPLSSTQNSYKDSSIVKGNKYKYAIKTADYFGGISEYSSSVVIAYEFAKPIAPACPKLFAESNGVTIEWGEIMHPDIRECRLYRYERGTEPKAIYKCSLAEHAYTDASVQKGHEYFYFLTTVSKAGVESKRGDETGLKY